MSLTWITTPSFPPLPLKACADKLKKEIQDDSTKKEKVCRGLDEDMPPPSLPLPLSIFFSSLLSQVDNEGATEQGIMTSMRHYMNDEEIKK